MKIEDLIQPTIASLKLNSQVRPTIYAELTTGRILTLGLLQFIGDSRQKAATLFSLGRKTGQDESAFDVVEAIFVAEIWLTKDMQNPNPGQKPPANVKQKEGVMFAVARNSEPFDTLVKVYELKRDKKKKPSELVFFNESRDAQGLMGGVAFLAGWHSRDMTDSEVRAQQPQGMRSFLKV